MIRPAPFVLFAAATAALAVSLHAATPSRIAGLAGTWVVTGVRVADSPVQAVEPDDPALIGAVLHISPQQIGWDERDGGAFDDVCPAPRLSAAGTIACAAGSFGPPGARLIQVGRRLRLGWYDGAILILTRRR